MIVNGATGGWDIIFQRNHALVAGSIAYQLDHEHRTPNWLETLSAIIDHDDGQGDWNEGSFVSKEGKPLGFTDYDYDLDQARRVISEAHHRSQWITLLVSKHTSSLYETIEDRSDELERFLSDQKELQCRLCTEFDMPEDELNNIYPVLRWCDECSLILCQNKLRSVDDTIKIGSFTGHKPNFITRVSNNEVTVEPWCFRSEGFSVEAEVFRIEKKHFTSTQELRNAVEATRPERRVWNFRKIINQ